VGTLILKKMEQMIVAEADQSVTAVVEVVVAVVAPLSLKVMSRPKNFHRPSLQAGKL